MGRSRRSTPGDPTEPTLRLLASLSDYAACVALQRETWGPGFTETVPASLLMISQKIGGIAAGAFDPGGRMLGFVWGLTGRKDGKPAHWSHMLEVVPEIRDRGLGVRLKAYQRELLLLAGVPVAYWTFDPLVSRNAHLNLNRLGARIDEYVPDYYGADTDSELHSGLGTDRFVAVWRLREARIRDALAGRSGVDYGRYAGSPIVTASLRAGGASEPEAQPLPSVPAVRVEIPGDIQAVKRADGAEAWRWREVTRRAFLHYLGAGYRVEGMYRDGHRSFYVMTGKATRRPSARRRGAP